jgi:hypothetical protein
VGDCVFCEIVAGRAAAHRLLEDEHTYQADELQVMWRTVPAADSELAALRTRVLRQNH